MNWLKDKFKKAKRAVENAVTKVVNPYNVKPKQASINRTLFKEVTKKRDHYLILSEKLMDKYGSNESTFKCDTLLFDALGVIGGQRVNLGFFFDGKRWFRTIGRDCMETGNSKSDISKDMLKGVTLAILNANDRNFMQKTVDYLRSSDWFAGDAINHKVRVSRCFISPPQRAEMCEVLAKLGGSDLKHLRAIPVCVSKNQTNFRQHLEALTILICHFTRGKISRSMLSAIKHYIERYPDNAVWAFLHDIYVSGNLKHTMKILKDERYFPRNRLPTSDDRKAKYLWERDLNEYQPDDSAVKKVYPGTDLIFVVGLIEWELSR